MAAFNFPSSPSNGDNYSANGVTFTYNSSSGAWIRASAVGAQGATGNTGAQGAIGPAGGSTGTDYNDDVKIRLGTDNDLQLFHDSTHTNNVISGHASSLNIRNYDTNSTNINLSAKNDILLQTATNESAIFCDANAGVHLYYDSSQKFVTTSSGGTITGSLTTNNGGGNAALGSHLDLGDNQKVRCGASDDLSVYHSGSHSYIKHIGTGNLYIDVNSDDLFAITMAESEHLADFTGNGSVKLYNNGSPKLETTSYGISIGGSPGSISGASGIEISNAATSELRLKNTSGGSAQGDGFGIQKWSDGNTYIYEYDPNNFIIGTNGVSRWIIGGTSGHITPFSNNTYDIGSSSSRVRNIYTNDLNLSNKGSTNSVDNTWGDYTIQEGESDLFLINNRNGKKYKFNLTEVL